VKYDPPKPWWLGATIKCDTCKGYTTLDDVSDASLMTIRDRGERVIFFCQGCESQLVLQLHAMGMRMTTIPKELRKPA